MSAAGKILVANLGSTSFKFRLFDMQTETQLARGGVDRIGGAESRCAIQVGDWREEFSQHVGDHAQAVQLCFDRLTDPEHGCLGSVDEVAGIGFKAVLAAPFSGVQPVNDELLAAMESLSDVAPAHNPPYARAMRMLKDAFPAIPQVAAFETGFHDTIPAENRVYAVPLEWRQDHAVQRWGFHGASHRYIGWRTGVLLGRQDLKVVSCHLGGSSSICAIRNGQSVANSLGMSPQSGLPHNNRVGDFDPFALPHLIRQTGKTLEQLLDDLATKSGLLGISGLSADVRDLEAAAEQGHERADLALKHLTASIRHYVGAYLAVLGGADVLVFTGGIGENSRRIRREVCQDMEWADLRLDPDRNETAKDEARVSADDSRIEVWTIPTNEELIVARQTAEMVEGSGLRVEG